MHSRNGSLNYLATLSWENIYKKGRENKLVDALSKILEASDTSVKSQLVDEDVV